MTIRRVPGSRDMTASGKLTELCTCPSSRKPRRESTAIMAQLRSASLVEAPRCGREMHLGCLWTAVEGKSHTYPPSVPSSRAATTAAVSTISARAKLSSTAVSFMRAIRWVLTRPRVESMRGTCTVRISALRNTSSMELARLTSADRCQACSTLMAGSYPMTFSPRPREALATWTPMAPSPMTPRVRPGSSNPTNFFFPASTARAMASSSPARVWAKRAAGIRWREAMNRLARTSSLTALALAPGVLNTGIPRSVREVTGILLVPAPARATASTDPGTAESWRRAERSSRACGSSTDPPTS